MGKIKCVICGMEINEKNYDFNKYGIINGNTDKDINSCPFCGVGMQYLIENGSIYEVDSEKLDDKTKIILDHAVKLELFNSDFYKRASEIAKDIKVKNLFNSLSKIEKMHAKVQMRLIGYTKEPLLNKLDYNKYDNDIILLEMSQKREEHAVNFYNKYIGEIDNNIIKEIFKAFICVEKEHIILTE